MIAKLERTLKPVFGASEQVRLKEACSATESS